MTGALRELYPPIEPYVTGMLRVDELHELYWEECGNPEGVPVVFLHGGPGAGCSPSHRRYFNPERFRIVLFDQRGAGRSTPNGEIRHNTTAHLVGDIEHLRRERGIAAWHVFGGSWGSTLAIAYGEAHPQACLSMTLRGIFLMRAAEIAVFFELARYFQPDAWESFLAPLTESLRDDPLEGYWRLLTDPEPAVRLNAARAWSMYEARCATLLPDAHMMQEASDDRLAYGLARIEAHFFRNDRYVPDDRLLQEVARIRHLPATIVQGRYDLLCPPSTAIELHRAWPGSQLVLVENAGHSSSEPGIRSALVAATDRLVGL